MKSAVLGGLLATAMTVSVSAGTTYSFSFNWADSESGWNAGSAAGGYSGSWIAPNDLVGLVVYTDPGDATAINLSVDSSGLPAGWSATTPSAPYDSGYAFYTGNAFSGAVGFSASFDSSVSGFSATGLQFAFFDSNGDVALNGMVGWYAFSPSSPAFFLTSNPGGGLGGYGGPSYAELTGGVVPGPMGVAAIAGLGLAGRRRRR